MKQAIADTQQMLLTSLFDDGELELYAAQHGWSVNAAQWPRCSRGVHFEVPWGLVSARAD